MNKYDLIKNIIDKYGLEKDIEEELGDILKDEDLTAEDIFKIKLTESLKIQQAFIKGALEKEFPSFLILTIINNTEKGLDVDVYEKQLVNNFSIEDKEAKEIIQFIKKEALYNNTLYKAMIEKAI